VKIGLPVNETAVQFSSRRIARWQLVVVALLVALSVVTRRGSPVSIVSGAALLYASFALQRLSIAIAFRSGKRGFAIGLFLLKLGLLLGVAVVGLSSDVIAPMSFAVGASSLLLAIVLEACYRGRSSSRGGVDVSKEGLTH
jgi:hypothetical protein